MRPFLMRQFVSENCIIFWRTLAMYCVHLQHLILKFHTRYMPYSYVCLSVFLLYCMQRTLCNNINDQAHRSLISTHQLIIRPMSNVQLIPAFPPLLYLPPILQAWNDDRSIFHRLAKATLILYHEIRRETQSASLDLLLLEPGCSRESTLHGFRVIRDTSEVISTTHESSQVSRPSVNIRSEDFHHVFLRIGWHPDLAAMAVGGDVQLFAIV